MPRISLIANPGSGSGEAERASELLADAGAAVELFPIDEAERASRSGSDRIAVAGGDGSVAVAAAAAGAAGVPLAVIPCGTANDFANQVGIPMEIEQACRLAVQGSEVRRLELARAGGRPFVNVTSAGLAPVAAAEAEDLKESIGALAYPVGAVEAGLSAEPLRCRILADGVELFDGEAWQVSVASGGAFGGGSTLLADDSDGLLDVVVIERGSRARLVKVAYGLTVGAVEDQSGVTSARVGRVELSLDPDAQLNIDGELITAGVLSPDGRIGFSVERAGFDLVVG